MTEAEMKKLTRADLVEMLIRQSTEMEALRTRLETAEEELHKRELAINSAGSIAEASLQLSGIFEAAEASCQQYLENIKLLNERIEKRDAETSETAARMLEETRQRCVSMEAETEKKCEKMLERARIGSQAYWSKVAKQIHSREDTASSAPKRIKDVDRKL